MPVTDERRSRLIDLVRQSGFAALPDLAVELAVSESTVRRDLDHLEEIGVARRTHGGVYYTGPSPQLPHFDNRQQTEASKKSCIARSACRLIEDGDTILLDGGSTTYQIAQQLVGRQLQIVTNSLPVANLFTSSDTVDLVLLGGYMHTRTGVTLGPYANEMLNSLRVRRAILSAAGIDRRGYYNSNLLLVETEQAMMKAADEVVIAADSTKFGRTSLARLCDLDEVNHLVVDDGIDEEWRDVLAGANVELVIAKAGVEVEPTETETGEQRSHASGESTSQSSEASAT